MKKLNILITGGAGFIGTHLYNQLIKNHNVKRIDNFKTSKETSEVVKMDLGNLSDFDAYLLEDTLSKTDIVYHFASSIGVDLISENPNETLQNSFNINNNLFPLFEKYQPKVIYASTSEVYGSRDGVMNEDDDLIIGAPTQMRWGYATQKLMSEFLIKTYTFPYTIARFFNVSGPGQLPDYGMVLPKFIEAAKTEQFLQLYNNGKPVRSFCDIRDAVNVLELLIDEMDGEILNIGNDHNTVYIKDLAERVIKISGAKTNIDYIAGRENSEIDYRVPCVEKMKTIYKPKYSLDELIESML